VRFVIYGSSVQCENSHIRRLQKNPVDMVRSLVPNLPGLDRDTVYVISGPFPNYDPLHGPSQLLLATPVSPGAKVVGVPSASLPCTPFPTLPHHMPVHHCHKTVCSNKSRRDLKPPQPMSSPHPPHMLQWDTHHPVGRTMQLRQPNPPVYYNVPSNTSSGLQSPASETSNMSETSSISGDHENVRQNNCSNHPQMMGYPTHNMGYQTQMRKHHHMHQQVPVYGQQY